MCGAFNFAFTTSPGSSSDTSSHLNSSSKILRLGPIRQDSFSGITTTNILPLGSGTTLGVMLDTNAAGTFVLQTPVGILGITGNLKKNEVASITLLISSDDVWKFPENIYFESDQNYLSCGKNIIGLFTYDAGETWIASVSHRGHSVANPDYQCIPGYIFGSCCYTNADGTLDCEDYTTRFNCDKRFGKFYPAQKCENTCGSNISVCCSNGKCTENISVTECEAYGGSYWSGITCGYANSEGSNYPVGDLNAETLRSGGRFCYDACSDVKSVCCKDGTCLGNYTRVQCELILGGKSLTGASCEDVNCCDNTTIDGACCFCNTSGDIITSTCEFLSYTECQTRSGFYMGPGKQCQDISCGCICGDTETPRLGSCCQRTTDPTTGEVTDKCIAESIPQVDCQGSDKTWTFGGNCSNCTDIDPPSETGICCKNGVCTHANTKTDCDAACGNWISTIKIQDLPCNEGGTCPGNIFTYTFGQNAESRDKECSICSLERPTIFLPRACVVGKPSSTSEEVGRLLYSFDNNGYTGSRVGFDKEVECQHNKLFVNDDTTQPLIDSRFWAFVDLLFNNNADHTWVSEGINHSFVIRKNYIANGINNTNILDVILETFNTQSQDCTTPGGQCLYNKTTTDTMLSFFATLYKFYEDNPDFTPKENGKEISHFTSNQPVCGSCCSCATLDADPVCNSPVQVDYDSYDTFARNTCVQGLCSGNTIWHSAPIPNCGGPSTTGPGGETSQLPIIECPCLFSNLSTCAEEERGCNQPSLCMATSGSLRNAKIIINNQELCIPILCTDNCDDFEYCEENL